MTPSKLHYHIRAGAQSLKLGRDDINAGTPQWLQENLGITFAGDSLLPLQTPPTIGAPLQFYQTILPGLVQFATTPWVADQLIGSDGVGNWMDEEVIQGLIEPVGLAQPYTDQGNIPLASFNPGWETRRIERFEQGYEVGPLEQERMSAAGIDPRNEKRKAAQRSLDYTRDVIAFYGFNSGLGRTFGILNDPALPAYVAVAAGTGGGTTWASKTSQEVIADIIQIIEGIRIRSGMTVDPTTAAITMGVPPEALGSLGKVSEFGYGVRQWLSETYPNVRVVGVPQFSAANGGANVIIAWADSEGEDVGSTDNGRTWTQMVPERLRVIGSEQRVKTFVEDLSNATAGVMLKRPYLVYAATGV
ncbi:MAG: DUF2184 domain-containing protein [Pseudomonas sp.]